MREKKFKKGSEKEEERREKKLKKEVRKRRTCSSALLLQCVLLKTGRTPPIDNFYISMPWFILTSKYSSMKESKDIVGRCLHLRFLHFVAAKFGHELMRTKGPWPEFFYVLCFAETHAVWNIGTHEEQLRMWHDVDLRRPKYLSMHHLLLADYSSSMHRWPRL